MYWKEIRSEAWARTKEGLGSGYRLTTSIVLPIIGGITTGGILTAMSIPIPATLIVGVTVTIGVYALFWFGEWCRHLITVPPERDVTRLKTIEERDATIAGLQAPRPDPIRIELIQVHFAINAPNISVCFIHLAIRNTGVKTTLEPPRLLSALYGDISKCESSTLGGFNQIIEIEERQKLKGSFSFQIRSPIDQVRLAENKWWMEIADIDGRPYKTELPSGTYVNLKAWQSPNP